jgi:transposase-like protein
LSERVKLQYRRKFTEEFKKARVLEYERGEYTVQEISKLFGIQSAVLYRWIYKYSLYNKKSYKIVEMKDSSTLKLKEVTTRMRGVVTLCILLFLPCLSTVPCLIK